MIPDKQSWKIFEENILKHSEYQRISIIKIPERVIIIKGKPIRMKSPFDYAASVDGRAVFFDAKSESVHDCMYFKSKLANEKSLQNQWKILQRFHANGDVCGFLVWFKKAGKIVWVSIKTVLKHLESDELSITLDTPGITAHDDILPIDLRLLTKDDRQ